MVVPVVDYTSSNLDFPSSRSQKNMVLRFAVCIQSTISRDRLKVGQFDWSIESNIGDAVRSCM